MTTTEYPSDLHHGKTSLLHLLRRRHSRRTLFSLVPTLTLGIIGGAVLPLAWAFSVTGIVCGVLIMVVVALANAYTCDLLLHQAHITKTYDYESLSLVLGGRWWKLATEIGIIVLLVGSIVGALAQIGEVGVSGLLQFKSDLPNWLVGSEGRLIIVFFTIVIVFPLCLVSKLRQLEYAGIVGTAIVIWLMFTVMINSISHGLPSLGNKQFAIVGFSSLGDVTQAVAIFGFAFYIQPMMMPLLLEVPDDHIGVKLVSWSTRITVLVNSFFIYLITGFFGAAYYGENTEDDILQNQWLGGGVPQGILNLSMAAYLATANAVLEFPVRHTIEGWLSERFVSGKFRRHLLITSIIILFSLAIALAVPSRSGDILVVAGATGVCIVSYTIPIVNHLLLHYDKSKFQKDMSTGRLPKSPNPNSVEMGEVPPKNVEGRNDKAVMAVLNYRQKGINPVYEFVRDVLLPVLVLCLGIFCSVSSLSTLGQE